MASEWYHQELAIVGTVDPTAATTAATVYTDAVDMDVFEKAIFIVTVNEISANTTLVLTLHSDTAATATGMTVACATSTALSGTADSNKQVWLEVDTEDMDPDLRHRYVSGEVVIGGTGGTIDHYGVVVLGGRCRYHPASNYDLTTVDSIGNS